MKKVTFKNLKFIPASHEDPQNPGVLKKVLYTYRDFVANGRVQMINWARLRKGRSFVSHYHEDMDEIFIIVSGKVKVRVDNKEDVLEKGDAVLVPMEKVHQMENIGDEDANYLVIGVSLGKGGQTVTK